MTSKKHKVSPQAKQQKPQGKETHTDTEISIASTKPEMPPSERNPKESDKTEKHWLDYATFGMEVLGFAALCIYATITWNIYCANRKSADAAESAAVTARQTFDSR